MAKRTTGRYCTRCRRWSDRIIQGIFCPSCYNRNRERIIGVNARGTFPSLLPPLHPYRVVPIIDGEPHPVELTTLDGIEALLVATVRLADGRETVLMIPEPV